MSLSTFTEQTLRILVTACTIMLVGIIWDISWHMTIGRDTFWTPAHLCIYLGAAVSGCAGGALAIKATFGSSREEQSRTTRLWGGRAPLGAWIAIWGALAMITSGPFDDWWHNAYGLDVKIISPPHVLLFTGIITIVFGALILALHEQNTGPPLTTPSTPSTTRSRFTPSYVSGIILAFLSILFFSEGYPNRQHTVEYYFLFSCIFPWILVAVARASHGRYTASKAALSYLAIELVMVWILPRFAATPKLGPVLNPVDHMVPPYFPHLLAIPALGIDWVIQCGRERPWKAWFVIPLCALTFGTLFMATQWTFSKFLITPAAHNAIFVGGQSVPYYSHHPELRGQFWEPQPLLAPRPLIKIFGAGFISVMLGWAAGSWMRKVRR